MTIQEITNEALKVCCEVETGIRVGMMKPFPISNGRICATDGTIILTVPKDVCMDYAEPTECKVPNVDGLLKDIVWSDATSLFCTNQFLTTVDDKEKVNITLSDYSRSININGTSYNKFCKVSHFLGIVNWKIMKQSGGNSNMVLFTNGDIEVILPCTYKEEKWNYSQSTVSTETYTLTKGMDILHAEEHITRYRKEEERKRIEKEEYDKSHEVFAVTFIKTATIYVHATSEEQAREICNKHNIYPDDYDYGGAEIDSVDYECCERQDYIEEVYDDDGEVYDAEVFFDEDE